MRNWLSRVLIRPLWSKMIETSEGERGPFDVLILRTELSDRDKAAAVARFLELPQFAMARGPATVSDAPGVAGEQADYREQYRELKRRAVIPWPHWDAIAGSKVARHFIAAGELAHSRERFEDIAEPAVRRT